MENQILACIKSRRSIRKYLPEQVSPATLSVLLEAAVWAPSGSNSQTWLFTAIQKKEILDALNEAMRQAFFTWTPDDDYPAKQRAIVNARKEGHNYFYNAPTLIIASNRPNYQNGMADCALALQNIFLAAHSLGLGSCWVNQLRWLRDEPALREMLTALGLPREHTIYGAAIVGHPGHTPPATPRKDGTTIIIS